MGEDVSVWYFIGMVGDRVVHTDHDVFSNDNGRDVAEKQAQEWFDRGLNIEGEIVEFDHVISISEHHETALDIRKAKQD